MRKQLLAGAMALALAAGITSSAMAFGHGGGSSHGGGFRNSYGAMRGGTFAGVRGFSSFRHGALGVRHFVGGYGYGGSGYAPYSYDDSIGLGPLGLGVGLADSYCSPYEYDPSFADRVTPSAIRRSAVTPETRQPGEGAAHPGAPFSMSPSFSSFRPILVNAGTTSGVRLVARD